MEFSRSPCAHAPATIRGGAVTPSSIIRETLIFSTPARHGTDASKCHGVGKLGILMEFSRSPCAHAPTTIQGGSIHERKRLKWVSVLEAKPMPTLFLAAKPLVIRNPCVAVTLTVFSMCHGGTWL
ncbi:hypothetical protein P8452_13948 [Trifolium repens]|nr:hypothetical protein P8452_13948 [Trifolium repens]